MALPPFSVASTVVALEALDSAKPARLTFEEAATLPVAFMTAHYALSYLGQLAPGERVLIHAATGGVGMAALQISRRKGS